MTSTEALAALAPLVASDSRAATFLEMAATRLTASAWGNVYVQAVALLAAHMLEMAPSSSGGGAAGAASGPVASKSAGDQSIAYGSLAGAPTSTADEALKQTTYGREFIALRDTRAAARAGVLSQS